MIKSVLWVPLAFLSAVACSQPASKGPVAQGAPAPMPPGWVPLRAEVFTVAMPGVPKENEDSQETARGKIRTHTFEVVSGSAYYLSLWTELPIRDIDRLDPAAALDGARDNAVLNAGGQLLGDHAMVVGGHPARDFSFSAHDDNGEELGAHARVILAGPRQLVFLAMTAKSDPREADVQRFLDSVAVE
jgi:hypothetical protein